jgi:hypothetical protein
VRAEGASVVRCARGLGFVQTLVLAAVSVGVIAVSVALARAVTKKSCEQGEAIASIGGARGSGGCGEAGPVARLMPAAEEFAERATVDPATERATVEPARVEPSVDRDGRIAATVVGAANREVRAAMDAELARGADAVELTRTAYASATAAIDRLAPGASPQERADATMALAIYALVGPGETTEHLAEVDSGETRVVAYLRDATAQAAANQEPRPGARDATRGEGTLNPRFSDGTRNQPFHINFFVAAGYVSAGSLVGGGKVQAAALWHETFQPHVFSDGGTSRADYVASVAGASIGAFLKGMRDRGNGDLMSSAVSAALARPGLVEPLPASRDPARNAIAQLEIERLQALVQSWAFYVSVDLHPVSSGLIGTSNLLQWLWGTKPPPVD